MRQGLRVFGIMVAQLKRAEGVLATPVPALTAHPAREELRLMGHYTQPPSLRIISPAHDRSAVL